jgi:hypothetical protein
MREPLATLLFVNSKTFAIWKVEKSGVWVSWIDEYETPCRRSTAAHVWVLMFQLPLGKADGCVVSK